MSLQEKYNLLQEILRKLRKVLIAYSGGVDSTFLLKVAVDTLSPENVLACIAKGPSLPKSQYKKAIEIAENMGVEVQTIEPNELADTNYSANKPDRCFHCKVHLLALLFNLAKKRSLPHVLCGYNFDDKDDFRPGNRAIKAFGARTPLADAKLTKQDIRQLSKQLDLPTAEIPASPCLASRITYGLQITEQRLKQIEDAEEFIRTLGLIEFRVRHHDTIARIEVKSKDFRKIITEAGNCDKIVQKLKSLGFKFITLDLQGFRSGSLNELLTEDESRKIGNRT